MWEALIGAGASLLGGKMASDAQDDANKANVKMYRNRIKWTVSDAVGSGINPLTALGAGVANTPPPTLAPVTGMGDAVADAGRIAQSAVETKMASKRDEEMDALKVELLKEQIGALRQDRERLANVPDFGLAIPQAKVTTKVQSNEAHNSLHPVKSGSDGAVPSGGGYPVVAGQEIEPHEGYSDAEIIEQRYGDLLSSAYGAVVLAADGYKNLKPKVKAAYKKAKKNAERQFEHDLAIGSGQYHPPPLERGYRPGRHGATYDASSIQYGHRPF